MKIGLHGHEIPDRWAWILFSILRGLLYKMHFLDLSDTRNKTNVNSHYRPQKGTFSSFLSVFRNYDRLLCHCDRSNR